jgi:hypothetical protein
MFHSVEITLLYEAYQAGARKMKYILPVSCLIFETVRSLIILKIRAVRSKNELYGYNLNDLPGIPMQVQREIEAQSRT